MKNRNRKYYVVVKLMVWREGRDCDDLSRVETLDKKRVVARDPKTAATKALRGMELL